MKCVCPSGGDRTCPDSCLFKKWWDLPPNKRTKEVRKLTSEQYYKQGYTMEAIAVQLGVSKKTISLDLKAVVTVGNNSPRISERGRKNEGRPKGSGKKAKGTDKIVQLFDAGLSTKEIAAETGLVERRVNTVLREEGIRQEAAKNADVEIDAKLLSMTAQEKLDAAIRQHKRRLDDDFDIRVRAELKRYLDEVALPHYIKQISQLERSIRDRRGIMDRITYRKILSCLHPDRVPDPSLKKRYEEAFRLFTELEKRVLNEKESPTQFREMPRTYEDLMAMKAKVKAERRAKHAHRAATVR